MLTKSMLSAAAAVSFLALAAAAPAQANAWVNLGVQNVEFNTDRDVFYVGWDAGRFDSLRFKVMGNQVAIADVIVFYGNGSQEHLNVKEHLQPGETTQSYDLKGDHRVIKRIEVLYQTEGGSAFGRAKVQILGSRFEGNGNGGINPGGVFSWEKLGERHANVVSDHDTFVVGAGKGTFRGLKLEVSNRPVHVYNLRVRFANGDVQDLPVLSDIQAGGSTGYIDLPGFQRTIDRVEIVYKTKGSYLGQAQVALYGKH